MAVTDDLKALLGPKGWTTDPAILEASCNEWRGDVQGATELLVKPASTAEVSAVLKLCSAAGQAVVPQGGNTGLCAGAVPDDSGEQIVLSLARMNSIRSLDADNFSMVVEAGCILQHIQDAAASVERLFALSLGAEGSCQIGGNLSTNAGGVNVLRYGTARAQVLGLEAVLADGTVISSLRALRKDTAGYDLKQLFIGSEGTLGIITAATLKLFPLPGELSTALVAVATPRDAVSLLAHLRSCLGDAVEAFELIPEVIFGLLATLNDDYVLPFSEHSPWYVLLDAAPGRDSTGLLDALETAAEQGLLLDAVIAKNNAEAAGFWRMRHSIAEAEKLAGKALKHDISIPVSRLPDFLERGDHLLETSAPGAKLMAFGHVGDGNLHYNVAIGPEITNAGSISDQIYDLVAEFGGSFSAEHGVGSVKRNFLAKYRSSSEIQLMKTLKAALDPNNILNPGKVI